MIKTEADLYGSHVRPGLSRLGMVLARIENGVGSGMPDVAYGYQERMGWLELKMIRTAFGAPSLLFEIFQIPWMRQWLRSAPGTVYVMATDGFKIHLYTGASVVAADHFVYRTKSDRKTGVLASSLAPVVTGPSGGALWRQTWAQLAQAQSQPDVLQSTDDKGESA